MAKGPILIELDGDAPAPSVADAPAVPETPGAQATAALPVAAHWVARRRSWLGRLFWALLVAALGAMLSIAVWDFVTGLLSRNTWLGGALAVLLAALVAVLLIIALRELAALARLSRLDGLRHAAAEARSAGDLGAAKSVAARLMRLYRGRAEMRWHLDRFAELRGDQMDADALIDLAEQEVLAPLDAAAQAEIETAARQVATVTALVPIALADIVAVLAANLRMIRRIAEIYGGRSGLWGGWRLTRAVLSHLVATGAVAIGDDMLEPLIGGSLLGKLSRRFGEGLVNGALTARVGVAAMDLCRPVPFQPARKPPVRKIVKRALTGLFTG